MLSLPTFLVLNFILFPSLGDESKFLQWITYNDIVSSIFTGVSWSRCALNQYLSGLVFSIDPTTDAYLWSGRCTNVSVGSRKREGFCWTSNVTLVQGSNGLLSLPREMLVMDGIRITYESYLFRDFYHEMELCLLLSS